MDQLIVMQSDTFPLDISWISNLVQDSFFHWIPRYLRETEIGWGVPSCRRSVKNNQREEKPNTDEPIGPIGVRKLPVQPRREDFSAKARHRVPFSSCFVYLGSLVRREAFSLDSAFHPGRRFRKDLEKKTRIRFRLWSRREKNLRDGGKLPNHSIDDLSIENCSRLIG